MPGPGDERNSGQRLQADINRMFEFEEEPEEEEEEEEE